MNTIAVIIWREWFNNKLYPLLFSLCIIVSLGAFLTLDALQKSVDDYITSNQKQIVGGDIIISSNQALPPELLSVVSKLEPTHVVYDFQFNSIAYTEENSLLTRIKAVSAAYPLYGELVLKNNHDNWPKQTVLVEQQVLSALNLKIGKKLKIGDAEFTIHDEIITEPDRPLTAFGFGARVIMHQADLGATNLLGQKSRVHYRIEIKTSDQQQAQLLKQLKALTQSSEISIKTAEQSNTAITNLSQNFLMFLKLLVIAVIVLSAIGIMSIVRAFVTKQQNTNAIRSALGEKNSDIIKSYRMLFLSMAIIAVIIAWLLSMLVVYFARDAFLPVLPSNIILQVPLSSLLKAMFIALAMTTLMIHMTLISIQHIKPVAVLHKHQNKKSNTKTPWLWLLIAAIGILLLVYLEINNIKQSVQIFIGLLVIWIGFTLMTKALMWLIKLLLVKKFFNSWKITLALQNIFRKNNQSNLFITTIAMTTMILASITLLDYAIEQQLISTYPEDAPNFFLLDVQTKQQQELDKLLGQKLTYYPVVRARIKSVNGVEIAQLKTKLGRYDNIERMFNLSYSTQLLATEKLAKSLEPKQLFAPTGNFPALSILNSFAEFLQVDIGDKVTFNIQGIEITTQITSIRKRLKRGPSPFFYFILPPDILADAPQIRFATAKVADKQRTSLQTQIAKKFPGITTLDGGSIAKKLKEFVDQLKGLIQIFTSLSIFAGLLIFITSLISTSQDRLRESFYYRMMGMTARDLFKLTLIEFLALGLFAFGTGVMVATIFSAIICNYWFNIDLIIPWSVALTASLITSLLLIVISYIYNNHVKRAKVIEFLATQ
ncbi:MAG: ABC transporter substrate-binding protein [Proteobacteria bacterium]|nr:ABC transporter substrate-binding protein [Pseudomonadota bacterium]